jgi:Lrp/AsnC family leucine-responsive transcriptional regulator
MTNVINLDLKDKKILKELNWNCRATNSSIAKHVGLSKKGVEYRIKKLESSKVIEGHYPFINFMKLGYNYCRLFIKLQYLNKTVKKQIEEFIKSSDSYNWSIWSVGEYDLVIGAWTKTLKEFKEDVNEFIIKFEKYIKFTQFSLGIQLDQFPYDFLFKEELRKKISMKEVANTFKIDKGDFLILKELTKNARTSILDISRELKLNPTTIKKRIEKLIKNEILLINRASINEELLGFIHYKLHIYLAQRNSKDIEKIRNYISMNKNTAYFVDEMGISDLDFEFFFQSNQDFLDMIANLQEKFSDLIKDYKYFIFRKTIKINFMPRHINF